MYHEVLDSVRNRVLDFVLSLCKEAPLAGELGGEAEELPAERVTQIVNMTILGGAASVIGSANHSTINVQVNAGDWKSLERYLTAYGVGKSDLDELRAALEEEPQAAKGDHFASKVAGWMAGMVGKAATGAWEVGVNVASSVLTEALKGYYGLP